MRMNLDNSVQFVGQYYGQGTGGLSRYERAFVDRLREDSNFDYRSAAPIPVPDSLLGLLERLPFDLKFVVQNNPYYIDKPGSDGLVHISNQQLAPNVFQHNRATTLVTVHDIYPLLSDQAASPVSSPYSYLQQRLLRIALKRADHIVASSMNTKLDLVSELGVSGDNISVIYLGVDLDHFSPHSDTAVTFEKLELDKHLLLYVGSVLPRKNIGDLLRAYGVVAEKVPSQLIIAGAARASREEYEAQAHELGVADGVVWLHNLPDEELAALYSMADVYVMPSRYEGFGLPVLEAMAAGTPVVSTDGGSLAEVVGSAGLLTPVGDYNRLASQILRVLTDADLSEDLVKAGRRNAQNFSWERTVDNTASLYNELIRTC